MINEQSELVSNDAEERTLLFIDAIHIDDDCWYGRTGVLYQALVAVNGQKYVLVIVIET